MSNKSSTHSNNEKKAYNNSVQFERSKQFLKQTELNLSTTNNIIESYNKNSKGYVFNIFSLNGVKYKPSSTNSQCYIRYQMTFLSKQNDFFGNLFKSEPKLIKINQKGYIEESNNSPLSFYFFSNFDEKQTSDLICLMVEVIISEISSTQMLPPKSLGWGYIVIKSNMEDDKKTYFNLYLGSMRDFKINKTLKLKEGSSVMHSCYRMSEIDNSSYLLPDFVILQGKYSNEIEKSIFALDSNLVPGLTENYFPEKFDLITSNIPVQPLENIYVKNIELTFPDLGEKEVLQFANKYFNSKIINSIHHQNSNNVSVFVKERRLICGYHNTWKFINSHGKENFTQLMYKNGVLISNNVQCIDNYFTPTAPDGLSGIIFELVYIISCNFNNSNQIPFEDLSLNLLTGFYVPSSEGISYNNYYTRVLMHPNMFSFSGEENFKFSLLDYPLPLELIISMNRDSFDKTYREEEINKLRNELEKLQIMYKELKKNENLENRNSVVKLESKIDYITSKLLENKQKLKDIYNKDDGGSSDFVVEVNKNLISSKVLKQGLQPILNKNIESLNSEIKNVNNPFSDNNVEEVQGLENSSNLIESNLNPKNNVSTNNVNENKAYESFLNNNKNQSMNNLSNINNFNNTNNLPINIQNQSNKNLISFENKIVSNENFNNTINNNINSNNILGNSNNYNINSNHLSNSNLYNDLENLSRDQLIQYIKRNESMNYSNNYNNPSYLYNNNIGNSYINSYQGYSREISSKDKAELLSKGALTLKNEEVNQGLVQFSLESELKSDLKAVQFIFHFMAYKPNTSNLNKINKNEDLRMKFEFSFWDFENLISDSTIIQKPENKIYSNNIPFILVKENFSDDKNVKLKINYDPNNDNFIDYRIFIEYLLSRNVFVRVFNSNSFLNYGYLKVPLKDFFRNGKSSKILQKEYELFDFNNHESLGHILLNISINSYNSKFIYDPLKFKQLSCVGGGSILSNKKKVVVRPMTINELTKEEKEIIGEDLLSKNNVLSTNSSIMNNKPIKLNIDPETQKKLRVLKYSNLVNKKDKYEITDPKNIERLQELKTKQDKEDKYFNTLELASKIKQIKKSKQIQSTIENSSKNSMNLTIIAGEPFFFNYIITNKGENEQSFRVVISRPNEISKNESEIPVKLVNDKILWNYIVNEEKNILLAPNNQDYDCITEDNYFILKSEEKIPLLFKVFSIDSSITNKCYTIWIYKGNEPIEYLQLSIVKVINLVDHKFEFNAPDNRSSILPIPNPFKYQNMNNNQRSNMSEVITKNQVSNHYHFKLDLDPTSNDFIIKYKPGEINNNHEFNFFIFLYLNEMRTKLYSTWEINIRTLETIDVQTKLGSKVLQKFKLELSERKTIQCYSSNNDIIYFTEKCSVPMITLPDIPNEIKFVVFPKKKSNLEEVLINVVDISNKILLKSVLVRVIPENPLFTHVVKIECNVGSVTHFKYEYQSKLNKWSIIKFESNDSEFLRVRFF